jgi:amidohydrolase
MNPFISQAQDLFEYSQEMRRDFHRHPELGFKEVRTAGIVARELTEFGMEVTAGVAGTGVVAMLETGKPGPVLLIRADMDALPIVEETGAEYASQNPGVMHACGHDGHTTILLTVAKILNTNKEKLKGTVKFIFQPDEEGVNGAKAMIEAGVLENPRPQKILGLHLWNQKPVGWLGLVPGAIMSGSDTFTIRLKGKGGHGGIPQQTIDPIVASANLILALQSIVSRNLAPIQSGVVSVCKIQAGETYNVIPPAVLLQGTTRYFEKEVQEVINRRLGEIVQGISDAMRIEPELEIKMSTPPVVNDRMTTESLQQFARKEFPQAKIATDYQTMVAEDMAFYLEEIPGTFFLAGSANDEKGLNYSHHHPRFDFDENVLPFAASFLASAARELLMKDE